MNDLAKSVSCEFPLNLDHHSQNDFDNEFAFKNETFNNEELNKSSPIKDRKHEYRHNLTKDLLSNSSNSIHPDFENFNSKFSEDGLV